MSGDRSPSPSTARRLDDAIPELRPGIPDPSATAPMAGRRGDGSRMPEHVAEQLFDDSEASLSDLIPADDGIARSWDPEIGDWVADDGLQDLSNTYDLRRLRKNAGVGDFSFPDWAVGDDLVEHGRHRGVSVLRRILVFGILALVGVAIGILAWA